MRSRNRDEPSIDCIACGVQAPRTEAREYDRFGDRWDRVGKRFEYLCKPCHDLACHLPRRGLEELLTAVGTRHASPASFVTRYYRHVHTREERPDA